MLELFESMKVVHERQMKLSSQLVSPSAAETASRASKRGQQKVKDDPKSLAQDYPGKGR
jgi:hypothetical protein